MKPLFLIFYLLIYLLSFSQEEEEVHSIFFEFDKYNLKTEQAEAVVAFVSQIHTSRIASVQIFVDCGPILYQSHLRLRSALSWWY
jgi:hypothetical protein